MVVVYFVTEMETKERNRLWSYRRLQPRGLKYPGQYVQSKVAQELVVRVNDLPAGWAAGHYGTFDTCPRRIVHKCVPRMFHQLNLGGFKDRIIHLSGPFVFYKLRSACLFSHRKTRRCTSSTLSGTSLFHLE